MARAIFFTICFSVMFGSLAKVVSWIALEWALARFPQEDVVSWATLILGIFVAAFSGGRAFEHFYPDDDD